MMAAPRELSELSFSNIITGKRVRTSVAETSFASTLVPKTAQSKGNTGPGRPRGQAKTAKKNDGEEQDETFVAWKRNIALLYDAIVYHSLTRSSRSCAFARGNAAVEDFGRKRTIYFSDRCDATYDAEVNKWGKGHSCRLFVGVVDVPEKNSSNRKYIGRFGDSNKSSRVTTVKRIIHPGEVSSIRVSQLHPSLLATQSSSPYIFLWDMEKQADRTWRAAGSNTSSNTPLDGDVTDGGESNQVNYSATVPSSTSNKQIHLKEANASIPEVLLTGHTANAEKAMEFSLDSHMVISGGSDCKVCVWNIGDIESSSLTEKPTPPGGEAFCDLSKLTTTLEPNIILDGHTKPVRGCAFRPGESGAVCTTVGEDCSILVWDSRQSSSPVHSLNGVHQESINCCSWNELDVNYIATGGSDQKVCVLDFRKLGMSSMSLDNSAAVVQQFQAHDNAVLNVQWSPNSHRFLASSGDEPLLKIWKTDQAVDGEPAELFFSHAGHKSCVRDFAWDRHDPWLFMSVSDDGPVGSTTQTGTIQLWRTTELLSRSTDSDFLEQVDSLLSREIQ